MKQELIKPIVKLGNSSGVVLPREWYGGKAKIKLIEEPINIKKDILEILDKYLENILGIYLVGSHARGEENRGSDVDVLVITNKTNKQIKQGVYDLMLVSQENLETSLENNVLPILPMLKEAKPIINKSLIKEYQKTKLTKKNLKWHIETTKSALKINKEMIKMTKDLGEKADDSIAYSLILRLREVYIVGCLIKNKNPRKKELINLIKKIAGSLKSYEGYLRVKNDKKNEDELPLEQAEKLYSYVLKKIKEQEKWVKIKN